ncbi:hypothetical protein Poli38472_005558 [Pythium oligandrum]|uniref:Transmembrane protein n=1 Tax=Pythium oligandrum TaxID=41045 RepID=A0A8K1FGM8_PYTOL|nr:hypothetical protein Poli38472_005558 [Pythium oligandrum]|eukprot:TMW62940.1 hypothetical protein Poli38472_005558 [Pythium oligandrum]
MSRLLWHTRLFYGVAAMSASVVVFSFLQEREEQEGREQEAAEMVVSSAHFFQAMESLQLTTQQKIEMRKFWRNLCNRKVQETRNEEEAASEASKTTEGDGETTLATAMAPSDPNLQLRVWEIQHFAREYKQVFPEIFPDEQVLAATRLAADAASQWNGIVQSTSSMIRSTGKRFHGLAMDTKDEMQGAMQRTVRKYLERALDVVADRLKHSLKDRHMPFYLQSNIDLAVDQFMPDVKVEIFRKTRDLFTQDSAAQPVPALTEIADGVRQLSIFGRLRGHILYHIFPHDKSIWMCFRDPWWIIYGCIGIFPVVGQLWWLFLFLIKDKTDEHQLCQFIVGFKAAQFVSLGLFSVAFGVSRYIKCIVSGALESCREYGPALQPWNASFFILQIALVWIAFFRLPYTVRPAEEKHPLLYRTSSMERREQRVFRDIFGNQLHLNRGGYLMKLCGYETVSFGIVVSLAAVILWFPFEPWQRKALFYWLRTAYGLFSLPFVIFKIPVLANVLMHTRRMGYNQYGDTVKIKKHE